MSSCDKKVFKPKEFGDDVVKVVLPLDGSTFQFP